MKTFIHGGNVHGVHRISVNIETIELHVHILGNRVSFVVRVINVYLLNGIKERREH